MKSRTTQRFRSLFATLPEAIQRQARESYRLFQANANHPGLRFRQVHPVRPVYSARINRDYRAVGIIQGDTIICNRA